MKRKAVYNDNHEEKSMSLVLPVGSADFKFIRENGYYYVDKTAFIKSLVSDSGRCILFTRPRRFGKTTFLTMLKSFFDIREDSKALFSGLTVMGDPQFTEQWMNKYPVIHLSFKDVSGSTFGSALAVLSDNISDLFSEYSFIEKEFLSGYEELFSRILSRKATLDDIRLSLGALMKVVSKYYGKRVIVLFDEYDVPLDKAAASGYYSEMLDVMRTIFSTVLKDNGYLERGILTGCLRVSRESIFTGLNNLSVYSITGTKFSSAFGFTEAEVRKLLEDFSLSDKLEIIRKWYDGYRIGNDSLYSVWDVIKYVDALLSDRKRKPENYWANVSGNEIIRRMIDSSQPSVAGAYSALIEGGDISVSLSEELTYGSLDYDKDTIWSLMFETGYLTLSGSYEPNGSTLLHLPNEEIKHLFISIVNKWFSDSVKRSNTAPLYDAIWNGDENALSAIISDYLFRTISYYDYSETYYHAFLAGLLSSAEYEVKSNAESGRGRPDILLLDAYNRRAAVFELKRAKNAEEMKRAADSALRQIDLREYGKDLFGYRKIIRYGIAFFEKDALVITA